MKGFRHLMAAAFAALFSLPALAAPVTDCPLRDAPFSARTPVIDILLSAEARKAVETQLPGIFAGLPPEFLSARAPTFASILTIQELAEWMKRTADMPRVDAALRRITVTKADKIARCERYDNDVPNVAVPKGRPAFLLFEKINGFRDGPSVDAAHAAFVDLARRKGWTIVTTDRGGAFTPSFLNRFDAVIWNNVSGDVLTLSQRAAFRSYMEKGGGFIGVHGSAGDPATFWDWYVDDLIGARFAGHPMDPQFQDARVEVEAADHPIARGLPREWVMKDEWYSFKNNPRTRHARVIATLDERSYKPGNALQMGDHPIAWTRCIGKGRMFYATIGHRPETYSEPHYAKMLENAAQWALVKQASGC